MCVHQLGLIVNHSELDIYVPVITAVDLTKECFKLDTYMCTNSDWFWVEQDWSDIYIYLCMYHFAVSLIYFD